MRKFVYEGPEFDEVPEEYREAVQRTIERGAQEQRRAGGVGIHGDRMEIYRRKERGELVAAVLDDIFPRENGSWGNLIDQLSGVERRGPILHVHPLPVETE